MSVGVGFVLQPDVEFLELCASIIEREAISYFEVAPETLWVESEDGQLRSNGFHRRFRSLREAGRRFVAHGVGFSLGTSMRGDGERTRRWLDRIRIDHAAFDFAWYTDHLGASRVAGENVTLPLPLEMNVTAVRRVQARLRALQSIVPDVGVENTASHFVLGDPLDEPAFLERITRAPRSHLLLDLHNVDAMAHNLGFDPYRYLERLPLDRVIEIHVAGGSWSDPRWLPSGTSLRLDGHDATVPERVFDMLAFVLPRCTRLRGVTLERMEGSVESDDVRSMHDEIDRIAALVASRCTS